MSKPVFPLLRIVPVRSLQPHELFDSGRTERLASKLEQAEQLINPPIVLPMDEFSSRFVVLDGANRTEAFRKMGLPDILVQEVRQQIESLQIQNWNHLVRGIAKSDLLEYLKQLETLEFRPSTRKKSLASLELKRSIALLEFQDGSAVEVLGNCSSLKTRIESLNQLTEGYSQTGTIERTRANRLDRSQSFPLDQFLAVYPRFTVQEVIHAANGSIFFPSGITRFIVTPRALHVNYPLERLKSSAPLERKQLELEQWMEARLHSGSVRYYEESTYVFEE